MKIIVALGNPGKKYELTRHNVGWLALDALATSYKLPATSSEKKFNSVILNSDHSGRIILAKPQTFMNLSGTAVSEMVNFYKVDIKKDLLIIHDEIDLSFGTIKFTRSSSSAGHNGVKDIIQKLGSQDFCRIRVGVENRTSKDQIPTDAFVLQNFTEEEINKLDQEVFPKVKEEFEKFMSL